MIVFLTLLWCIVLLLLVKLKVITLTLWWKLSPVIWMVLLLVVLFIPMQFGAPSGQAVVLQYSVSIVPNVTGQVTKVHASPNAMMSKGDLLYELDPTLFQAQLDQVTAQLELARIQLEQTEKLFEQETVSEFQLDKDRAQVRQLEASLKIAQYNLRETAIRAPANGFVTNVGLRPGARVTQLPLAQTMAFVETDQRLIVAQIPQAYLRHVKPKQAIEITFKGLPGQVYSGTVDRIIPANAMGQVSANGQMFSGRNIQPVPFAVRINVDAGELLDRLPAGAVGSIAIYTEAASATHVIRRVMIRMDAFMNYVIPT